MTEYFLQICTAKPCIVDEVEEGGFQQLNNSQRSLDPHQRHFGKHHRALVDCVHRHIVCRHVAQVVVECLLCWWRQYRPQIVHICAREWCNNSHLLTYLLTPDEPPNFIIQVSVWMEITRCACDQLKGCRALRWLICTAAVAINANNLVGVTRHTQ